MIRVFGFLVGFGILAVAQSPNDHNEGGRMTFDRSTGVCTFNWWGRSGMSYFVRCSEDLVNWFYLPLLVSGADAVSGVDYQPRSGRLFMKLEIEADPFHVDRDNDGMSDGWEIINELDPGRNDAAEDPDGDGLTNIEECVLQCKPGRAADTNSSPSSSLGLVIHTIID